MEICFELEKIVSDHDRYIVFIVADSNDGDYVTEYKEYTENQFELILPLVKDLRDNYMGEFEYESWRDDNFEDYSNEELERNGYTKETMDAINSGKLHLPTCYVGTDCIDLCHTLEELKVVAISADGEIYNVCF